MIIAYIRIRWDIRNWRNRSRDVSEFEVSWIWDEPVKALFQLPHDCEWAGHSSLDDLWTDYVTLRDYQAEMATKWLQMGWSPRIFKFALTWNWYFGPYLYNITPKTTAAPSFCHEDLGSVTATRNEAGTKVVAQEGEPQRRKNSMESSGDLMGFNGVSLDFNGIYWDLTEKTWWLYRLD